MNKYPKQLHTVIDTTNPRRLAEFYRQLLGYLYRDGDAIPANEERVDPDWLVLTDSSGSRKIAFQQVEELAPTTWPSAEVPMQMHIDFTVADIDELEQQRARAEVLGATLLSDSATDPVEPLYVFADPAGHPFCIFVA